MNGITAVIALWLIMILLASTGIHWPYYVQHPWIVAAVVFIVASLLQRD